MFRRGGRRGGRGRQNFQIQRSQPVQGYSISTQQRRPNDRQRNTFKVEITGFATNTSKRDLITYINHSYPNRINILQYDRMPGKATLYVRTEEEKNLLEELNGAQMKDGNQLHVIGEQPQALKRRNEIMELVGNKYNFGEKVLDLQGIAHDFTIKGNFQNGQFVAYLLDAIKVKARGVKKLDLSANEIETLRYLNLLGKAAPKLKELGLINNQIKSIRELDHIKDIQLTHLYLLNNPVRPTAPKQLQAFLKNVETKFPHLQTLDDQQFANINFNLIQQTLPDQNLIGFEEKEDLDTAKLFLSEYFEEYDGSTPDHNRSNLIGEAAKLVPASNDGNFANYLRNSRNITKMADFDSRKRLLKFSNEDIVTFLQQLPKSTHNISGIDVTDLSFPKPGNQLDQDGYIHMIIRFSGYFEEHVQQGQQQQNRGTFGRQERRQGGILRPYSRTFIVQGGTGQVYPIGPPGPAQQTKTWTLNIVSDHLHIAMNEDCTDRAVQIVSVQSDNQKKENMKNQLGQRTNLTPESCEDCLVNASWDLGRALDLFQQTFKTGQMGAEFFNGGQIPNFQ
ncbi:MAG: putative nuclear RNA export factor 1 [Streblomastix strix]|uniref:Putative nuclear RNA export factor 1 n=1 Tax=Streblomastix strix TaxID=222440 RepID=A0A5J4X411_9EUKA|nr:MAG: putative nuclear RNA export factor 1 [Streblomastix strix]